MVTLVFAFSSVVRGMYGATRELQKTGSADPEALAGDLSVALLSMFWSVVVSVPVFVLLVVSVIFYRKWRKVWHQKQTPPQ
jgi:heme/copper-type cytochrome/quinol oxidase subunit 2